MMNRSMTTKETPIQVPFSFFLFAALSLPLSQAFLLFGLSDLAGGTFRSLPILAAVHLYLLGFALMVATGAVYQLAPVVFLTPIRSLWAAYVQAIFLMVGTAGLVLSFNLSFRTLLEFGGVVLAGILLFIIHLFLMLSKTKLRNTQWFMAIFSLTFLSITVLLGLLLGGDLSGGWELPHASLFTAHLSAGLGGWFTLLIFTFSYKMIPMFSLAHNFSMKTAPWVFGLYAAGVLWAALSPLTGGGIFIGFLLTFAGFTLFLLHSRSILKKGLKKRLDPGFRFALYAIGFGEAGHLLLLTASLLPDLPSLWIAALLLLAEGWIGFSIIGYLYKIVPFLWWTHKYSGKVGKEKVPTLQEMMFEREAEFLFPALTVSFLVLLAGMLTEITLLAILAQGALFFLTLYFLILMFRVVRQ